MSSVTNMILQRGPSRSMTVFVRAARKNTTSGIRFQRGLSPAVSAISVEDGPGRRNLSSTHKISNARRLGVESHSFSSVSVQRRFRSALPDDYYESDEESAACASTDPSAKPFLLADIGEGIAEVELLRWFVEEGQAISEFDPVCEVQSDKATVEITSRYEGTVQKLAYPSTGSMIKVGEPILWILEKGGEGGGHNSTIKEESTPSEEDSSTMIAKGATASPQDPRTISEVKLEESSMEVTVVAEQENGSVSVPFASSKVLTSPAVRKLARENGLDLATITGTGPSGRILKGDCLAILQESCSSIEPEDSSVEGKASPTIKEIQDNPDGWDHPLQEDTVVPMRGYNRIMADTMTASLKIPHMVYSDEINLNRFVRYKMEQQQLDHQGQLDKNSKKLLFLPFAIKAASKALEEYPWLNASYDDDKHEATLWKDHNIGIAMDTPRGLIVPVIKECQNKSLPELAEELTRLKESVMEGGGGLPAKDLQGATFTLSNVGAIGGGGTYMSPIITPPQVGIGALGQIRRLPRFVSPSSTDPAQSQAIEEAHILAVSWAADHRVVDGATVARFHKSFKEYMEDPIKLLLELR